MSQDSAGSVVRSTQCVLCGLQPEGEELAKMILAKMLGPIPEGSPGHPAWPRIVAFDLGKVILLYCSSASAAAHG